MTGKKVRLSHKIKLVVIILILGALVATSRFFSTYKIASNKMLPTYKNGAVLLIRTFFDNEEIKQGDVLIYRRKYVDGSLAVGRVLGENTLTSYLSRDKFESDTTANIKFAYSVLCPVEPNTKQQEAVCYSSLSLDDLKAIGYPVVGDNLLENTTRAGNLIVDAPSREDIQGIVIMCLAGCR